MRSRDRGCAVPAAPIQSRDLSVYVRVAYPAITFIHDDGTHRLAMFLNHFLKKFQVIVWEISLSWRYWDPNLKNRTRDFVMVRRQSNQGMYMNAGLSLMIYADQMMLYNGDCMPYMACVHYNKHGYLILLIIDINIAP